MTNPLVHKLPDELVVGDKRISIDTSHRRWLQVARLLDAYSPDYQLIALALRACGVDAELDEQVMGEVSTFLAAGDESPTRKRGKRVFCWEQDAHRVVAAFQHDYQIDLTDPATVLHWWRFCYLFRGLSAENDVMQAIRWRSTPKPKGKYAEDERKQWAAMQKAYKLYPRSEEEAAALADKDF